MEECFRALCLIHQTFSHHHISCRVTISCHTVRVLPLLAVLVHLKLHAVHECVFNFNRRAYHTSRFSDASPSRLPLSIIAVSLDGRVALYHVTRSLCQFRGRNRPSAWSPVLLLMDFLNIYHDLEAADTQSWSYVDLTDLWVFTQSLFPLLLVVPLLRLIFGLLIS